MPNTNYTDEDCYAAVLGALTVDPTPHATLVAGLDYTADQVTRQLRRLADEGKAAITYGFGWHLTEKAKDVALTEAASEHARQVREITDLARLALIDAKQADDETGDWRAAAESAVANLEVLVDRLRLHALPDVPTHEGPEGSPIAEFEISPVAYHGDSTTRTDPDSADAWGVYVIFEDAPSLHVEDYTSRDLAEYIAAELAAHHGVEVA